MQPFRARYDSEALGQQIRQARRARGFTLKALAERTGLSLRFLSEIERGKEGASIGRVLQVAEVLGLTFPVQLGQQARVDLERYPVLKSLAWQRRGQRYVDETDALALYEAQWRFVEPELLLPREATLIRELVRRHGHGVLNV